MITEIGLVYVVHAIDWIGFVYNAIVSFYFHDNRKFIEQFNKYYLLTENPALFSVYRCYGHKLCL
jgi:hypothetical protein